MIIGFFLGVIFATVLIRYRYREKFKLALAYDSDGYPTSDRSSDDEAFIETVMRAIITEGKREYEQSEYSSLFEISYSLEDMKVVYGYSCADRQHNSYSVQILDKSRSWKSYDVWMDMSWWWRRDKKNRFFDVVIQSDPEISDITKTAQDSYDVKRKQKEIKSQAYGVALLNKHTQGEENV